MPRLLPPAAVTPLNLSDNRQGGSRNIPFRCAASKRAIQSPLLCSARVVPGEMSRGESDTSERERRTVACGLIRGNCMWRMQREDDECADSSRSSIYLGNGMQQLQVGGEDCGGGTQRRKEEVAREEQGGWQKRAHSLMTFAPGQSGSLIC